MCYIHRHVFDKYNNWFSFMAGFVEELESLERLYMYMLSYKSVCLYNKVV